MENKILNMKMSHVFDHIWYEPMVILHYIAITFEILAQNKKIVFLDSSCCVLSKNVSFI